MTIPHYDDIITLREVMRVEIVKPKLDIVFKKLMS